MNSLQYYSQIRFALLQQLERAQFLLELVPLYFGKVGLWQPRWAHIHANDFHQGLLHVFGLALILRKEGAELGCNNQRYCWREFSTDSTNHVSVP